MTSSRARRPVAIVGLMLVILLVVGAGAGAFIGGTDSDDPRTSETTANTEPVVSTTAPPDYTGDPNSPFCALVREADARPTQDPFAPDIAAAEVELRFRAFKVRFVELAAAAPSELTEDLSVLVAALEELDVTLAAADYDFVALRESGADLSGFDNPAFIDVGTRLAQYRSQVCDLAAGPTTDLNNP